MQESYFENFQCQINCLEEFYYYQESNCFVSVHG